MHMSSSPESTRPTTSAGTEAYTRNDGYATPKSKVNGNVCSLGAVHGLLFTILVLQLVQLTATILKICAPEIWQTFKVGNL